MTDAVTKLSAALADRYRIERELGAGGMATVYLAQDVKHDRKVALKVLRPELAAILGGERFLAEIKTTANLQHPHILALHDSGEADGLVYYVMPYIEGESLRDRLVREKQLPVEDAVRITREVADALAYAHAHGIVHRDIKPENILLHGGHALVADFGIALAASRSDGGTRMTETGMSLGTPHYMSPEQAMGEREITAKSDVYALGCVLYEMLTGEPPFTGPTAQAIIARVMTEEPRSLTIQRRTVPAHVEAAVHTALAKLPADRFATAAQFAEALGNAEFAVPATRAAPAARRPKASRRELALRALPWVLFATAGAAAAAGWMRVRPPVVTRQRVVLSPRPYPPGIFALAVAISPDGNTIVYADTAGTPQLWSKSRDELEANALTGTANGFGPAFSPDGEWIAFVADGKLKKVPRLGGSAITIADSANGVFPAIAWMDDGTVVFNDDRYSLRSVSAEGGPVRMVTPVDSLGRGLVTATPLPGGRGVLAGLCTPGCNQVRLEALELPSGRRHQLGDDIIKGWYAPDGHVLFARQDGGVFRAPFDLKTMAFRTAPVPVLQGVRTTPGRADMALSRSGLLLYVNDSARAVGARSDVVWVARNGAVSLVDSAWSFEAPANFGLALSPDGRRLALSIRASGHDDIWIKELDRGPLTRLTFTGVNVRPEWTADGRTVMYVSNQGGGGNEDIRARNADGTGAEQTLVDVARGVWEVVRTRDTAQLIVRYTNPPSRDILLWRRGADSAATPLLAADYQEVMPALSPDGRWLAYASDESGRNEVYVRPFPNVDGGRWQVSRSGGSMPAWAHSGRELFYLDGEGRMVAVTVGPGASFVSGEQRVLFSAADLLRQTSHRTYDVTPDDRRFVFVRPQAGRAVALGLGNMVQVDNWFAELRAGARNRR